ncbi:MAG: iron ABC transporter permease [Crocinitomicaceae bacterium]|nr:iron ABC transporter permease [Crocinitomicaceae bacterium]
MNRKGLLLLLLALVLLLSCFLHIQFTEVSSTSAAQANVLWWEFRFPRLISALVAGAGLSLSGLLMQNLFRNPMAGPYVLGINSGASLTTALLMLGGFPLMLHNFGLVGSSLLGAFLAAAFMFFVSWRVQQTTGLLLVGLMFASFTGSIESVLQSWASPEQVKQFFLWNMGSLQQLSAAQVPWLLTLFTVALLWSLLLIRSLNAFVLGQDQAFQLGVRTQRVRFSMLAITALLAGSITAYCGPIAFVGLAIPNLGRQLLRTQDHFLLIIFCLLFGALFLLGCDILSVYLEPYFSLPINVLTSLIGAPYIAYLVLRRS